MYTFDYQRPEEADAAVKTLTANGDAKFLAGGQSLLPTMRLRLAQPSALIDVTRIASMKQISVSGDTVTIGGAVCHAQVAANADVKQALPGLADLAGRIGDRQVRERGTIGGSLANDDPAACYPSAVLALNATVVTDRRRIAADDFFLGMYETALEPDELITAVEFPLAERAAYEKFRNPASHFALVGVFVAKRADGVRVAVTGAAPSVFRAKELEAALSKDFSVASARSVTISPGGLNDDMHASAVYRAHLIPVLAGRAIERANAF
ncbi:MULTISPECIES: xanthine dehydrogenase family protein subunit M [unclassified Caballeronia]|uniref:FAD binding domain-containing protein n=1 Tax=unclassified Caballeronia TaxID=2646786 RepID=UPI0028586855|nr:MULTISPECIES: xanthine dehydrogenase family protein subunit M [unclassified Caballeronia]MDR5749261.1 xanthine dehydrogenase family protein subunit M [Caballeronia sp. LZ024]MDR5843608.1 xanthine dehydrogenase family protein subunit M [Caballeronia sp. LZ031]